ncbi:MAG: hypothetical protein ACKO67_06915 [Bacteroidota bacterium]
MESTFSVSQSHEFQLEQSLRKLPWLIPAVTLLSVYPLAGIVFTTQNHLGAQSHLRGAV